MPEITSPAELALPAGAVPAQRRSSRRLIHNGSLVVDGIVVDAPNGTRLLDGVGFAVPAGSLVGVAGPTGSGKTTLSRALTGGIAIAAGSVSVAGREVAGIIPSHRGIGYVPQEDALHAELSVRRTLIYAAALRMAGHDPAEQQRSVDAVLDEVRLGPQADLAVGSLSVGQRKRVCIAIEMLSHPAVLVLDEPTSSLDPGYEATVMTTLRRLADLGHIIVVVTHSQLALADCDQVALLASGGRLAYFGSPARMHEHFGTTSAAQLFTALDEAGPFVRPGPTWVERRTPDPVATLHAVPTLPTVRDQLSTLTRRYFDLTFADRRRSWLFAVQTVVLGSLLIVFVAPGGLARPVDNPTFAAPISATGMAVLLAMCVTWLGMSSAVREIVKERRILVREHSAGLSPAAYVGSKIAVLGPLLALQAAGVTAIAVMRQAVPGSGAVLPSGILELAVAMALAGISAVTLALFVSAVVRSADKALAVLPMLVVVEFVLSGLTPAVSWLPGLAQMRDLAGTRWAVQAVSATVTGDTHAWWTAVAALFLLSVVATAGTYVVVRHSLRLPTTPQGRRSPSALARGAVAGWNPEMVRLVRIGATGLAVVALIATGARIVAPGESTGGAPVMAAAAPAAQSHTGSSTGTSPLEYGAALPGMLGDVWWLADAGTRFSLEVAEAAYMRSLLS